MGRTLGPQPTPGRLIVAGMTFYRRRLPHFHEIDQPVFLTWRLHDSLPPHRAYPTETLNSGRAFAAMDRLLDELHAFLVMPNHVRLLATPALALPKLTKSLKGITARRASAMLVLTGSPFSCGICRSSRRSGITLKEIQCGRG